MTQPDPLANLSPDQQRELLQKLLQQKAEATRRFPMSAGQQGLWYAFRRDPSATTFNVYLPSRVRSVMDVEALRGAINYLVDRHPCLRTTFTDAGQELRQEVNESLPPEYEVVDASDFSEDEIRRQVIVETLRPFDLETGPLLRLKVFRKAPDDCVVVATTHHIVNDFWSLILILSELREAYPSFLEGREPNLPPIEGHYSAFVEAQQQMLDGPQGERLWEHWKKELEGSSHVLEWCTDFRRPPNFTGRADVAPFSFPPGTTAKVNEIAKQTQTTPTAVVMAAMQVFIRRSTNQESFLVGSPFSGRGQRKFEDTVGFFVNMLPVRVELADGPSFLEYSRRVGQTVLTALEHESFPFAQIVRRIQPPRDPARSPMFQVSCTFEKAQVREESGRAGFLLPGEQEFADFGGLQQESYYIPHPTCHYDIEFIFEQTEDDLRGMIVYCRDLFAPETAAKMSENFEQLLGSLLDDPSRSVDDANWYAAPSRHEETGELETLVDLVSETSDGLATIDGDHRQTHAQLQQSANTIAAALQQRGIAKGDYVPVIGQRNAKVITAILGVMKAGAVVVPIDADQPAIGTDDLVADTGAKLIITDTRKDSPSSVSIDQLVTEGASATPVSVDIRPEDLAYAIYTSGSTGTPKGVMVQHAAIANTLRWRKETVTLSPNDRVLMVMSHQFDAGFGIILSTLAQGATVVWGETAAHDIDSLVAQIVRDEITVLLGVPSLVRLIAAHPHFKDCRCLQQVWCGGETMPAELPELIWKHTSARIWNLYGPTEAAVEAIAHEVIDQDPRRPIPIGTPIRNTEVLILDPSLNPVPDTVPGQLAIRGRGLAVGYLNQPELTSEKFVTLPSDSEGSRVYLTGDLCRRRIDGEIDFLGRIDDQVKVRGYRIELEEIDAVLRLHDDIENAAVKVIGSGPSAQIAAFVTRGDSKIDDRTLLNSAKRHAGEQLPPYKRPAAWKIVDQLPIGLSGKVNRRKLPDTIARESDEDAYVAPSTPLEKHLADVWAEMLKIDHVGVNQNFFQLGGSSLQAAMMTTKLSEDLGVHVPTALLFDLADIAKLAQRLVQLHEMEMANRFGTESTTAYSQSALPSIHSSTGEESTAKAAMHPLLAPLKKDGERTPIFMVHPPGGIVICYRELAAQLDEEQPLLAIRSRGLHGREKMPGTIQEMAADYIDAIKRAQPVGPYIVGGWSLGGIIAYEIAQQLLAAGEAVQRLVLLDSTIPDDATDLVDSEDLSKVGDEYGIDLTLDELSDLKEDDQLPFLWQHAINLGVLSDETPKAVVDQVLMDLQSLFHHHVQLTNKYRMKPLDASVLLVRPSDVPFQVKTAEDRGWSKLVREVQVEYVSGHHHSMVQMPQVAELAVLLDGRAN